jgi:hypothetical protein
MAMDTESKRRSYFSRNLYLSDTAILWYLAFIKLIIHFAVNLSGGYGYFRDELYYLACSDHMAWGYVDQPPFSIAVLFISRLLFGDSLFAIRLFPAIAGAVVVAFAGLITRELGGKRYAQVLASCCTILAPLLLGMNSFFSMNSFDILFWTIAFYLIILCVKKDEQKYWFSLGIVLGLGLLNKISVLWLGTGLAFGLLFTPQRKLLFARRVWFAAAMAFFLFLPHIIWQVNYNFPTMEFIKNATSHKYVAISPMKMFVEQVMNMNPSSFPLWFAGLIYFLIAKSTRQFRILPLIYLTVFIILVINRNSKSEYMGPMFPMLFALGAYSFETFLWKMKWRWLKPVMLLLLLPFSIVSAPFALAVLPVESFISYSQTLGMKPSTPEKKQLSSLPQFYADMFGWEKMAAAVSDAYNTLTPDEKIKCVIICNNYGEAGAIDFFGPKYHLPKAISGHNNYWLWGPRNATGEVVIRMGGKIESLKESYRDVIQVGVFKDDYCMPYENNMPVWICKKRNTPLQNDWANFRHYE